MIKRHTLLFLTLFYFSEVFAVSEIENTWMLVKHDCEVDLISENRIEDLHNTSTSPKRFRDTLTIFGDQYEARLGKGSLCKPDSLDGHVWIDGVRAWCGPDLVSAGRFSLFNGILSFRGEAIQSHGASFHGLGVSLHERTFELKHGVLILQAYSPSCGSSATYYYIPIPIG